MKIIFLMNIWVEVLTDITKKPTTGNNHKYYILCYIINTGTF